MTLIEIIAGLVILAVLVSAVTLARGRAMRQWGDAELKRAAAQSLDRMLAGWVGGGGNADAIPVGAAGALEAVEGCTWRTTRVYDAAANRLGATVVRVEVFHGSQRLLSVDLMKHLATLAERRAE